MSEVSVGCIVEGQGEVSAVPVLVRRVAGEVVPGLVVRVPRPHRLNRGDMKSSGTAIGNAVRLFMKRLSPPVGVLLVLDADDQDPAHLLRDLADHLRGCRSDIPSAVVVACREYEAWFLAAAESLRGQRGLRDDLAAPLDPDAVRGAKEWLAKNAAGDTKYRQATDQAALTELFDMAAARKTSPSFARAYDDIARLLTGLVASLPSSDA